jgi:hypothetical protein
MQVLNSACFGLYFNVGDITISANREEIHYTEKTKTTLINRVNELIEDFTQTFNAEINKEKSFFDALVKFNGIYSHNGNIGTLISDQVEYNGIKLHHMVNMSGNDYVKVESFYDENGAFKHCRKGNISLNQLEFAKVLENDEKLRAAPLAKMKSLYYNTPQADRGDFQYYVVSFIGNNTKGITNPEPLIKKANDWKKEHYFDHFGFKKTSTIPKGALPKNAHIVKCAKTAVYREMRIDPTFGQAILVEHEDYEDALTGYYVMSTDGHVIIGNHSFLLRDRYEVRKTTSKLREIFKYLKIDKLIILSQKNRRVLEVNKNLIPLDRDILNVIVKSIDKTKLKEYTDYMKSNKISSIGFVELLQRHKQLASKINENSWLAGKLKLLDGVKSYMNTDDYKLYNSYFDAFSDLIHAHHKVSVEGSSDPEDNFGEKYPLLNGYNRYGNYSVSEEKYVEHAIEYINVIDTKN